MPVEKKGSTPLAPVQPRLIEKRKLEREIPGELLLAILIRFLTLNFDRSHYFDRDLKVVC